MKKAYDKVDWRIRSRILQLHGVATTFSDLVYECISSATYSILLNGSPVGKFAATRGIRQDDSLSPVLFTIVFDILSRILTKVENDGKIHIIRISITSPTISHLMYEDDLTIYGRATTKEATEIMECIWQFCTWTGQEVNFGKSSVHFSKNTRLQIKADILRILNMEECNHITKYLGLPFCRTHKGAAFSELIDRVGKIC